MELQPHQGRLTTTVKKHKEAWHIYKPLGYCCHCHVHQHTRSKIKEKVSTENVKDKSRDSITNKDTPVNIALGPKDKDTVEKKDQRNTVLWRYFGFLKSGKKQSCKHCRLW